MEKIFIEENGRYGFNCTEAEWASDKMHKDYREAGLHIKDTDLLIENGTNIFMIEYKNACIPGAKKPEAFNPESSEKISDISRKFFDSLHYLNLLGKNKPIVFVYIVECVNGDVTMRKRLRNKLQTEFPFALQENIGTGRKIIEKLDVVSIEEWNEDEIYGKYPLFSVIGEE